VFQILEQHDHTQTEKAYLKQDTIFLGNKRALLKKESSKLTEGERKKIRFFRNIGLGFETPKSAIEGHYIDHKCPFTGNVSIRGRILSGVVKSNKMKNTVIVRRDYLKYVKKYRRYEKRHKNLSAHCSPCFEAKEGDNVVVGECRTLSKTIRFNVVKVLPKGGKKKFSTY